MQHIFLFIKVYRTTKYITSQTLIYIFSMINNWKRALRFYYIIRANAESTYPPITCTILKNFAPRGIWTTYGKQLLIKWRIARHFHHPVDRIWTKAEQNDIKYFFLTIFKSFHDENMPSESEKTAQYLVFTFLLV